MKIKDIKTASYFHSKQTGFALLYVMLVLASIIVGLALSANQSAFFSANRLKSYSNSAEVRMIADYCGENLLMEIRDNPALVTTGTLSYSGGSCDYSITGTVPVKVITLTASKNNIFKKLTITTSQIYSTIQATWVETN